jgi:hypothetical protein
MASHVAEAPDANRETSMPVPTGTLADVTERLFAEFEPRVSLTTIIATVHDCRRDLAGAPPPALPELVERLARQRLTKLTEHPSTP